MSFKLLETDWGAERKKNAQGTIKISVNTDFTSDLTHILVDIGDAQRNNEHWGAEALSKRCEITHMPVGVGC